MAQNSDHNVKQLSGRVDLDQVSKILLMYSQALAGARIQIDSYEDSEWCLHPDMPATDEATIFLPSYVDRYDSAEENFAWYKVAVTHQAGHIEFGTLDFSLEKAAGLFPGQPQQLLSENEAGLTDIERFFSLFSDRKLAAGIFAVAEDIRIDYLLKQEYAGIRGSYRQIQQESLSRRPLPSSLPLREAFLESLVRVGLGSELPNLPEVLRDSLQSAVQILQRLQSVEATVEDSAEVTLRLYDIISALPDKRLSDEPEGATDLSGAKFMVAGDPSNDLDTERSYQASVEGELRGDSDTEPFSLDDIKNFVGRDVELDEVQRDQYPSSGFNVNDLLAGSESQEIPSAEPEEDRRKPRAALEETLESDKVRSFLYDEWDFRGGCYLPKWCRVREVPLSAGSAGFFKETLARHSALALKLRKQFEMLAQQRLKKLTKLQDGEEIDLDAMIESVIERKAGQIPNDKIYWKRMKTQRDVAVVFLIDMSASTSELIKDADEGEDSPDPDGSPDTTEAPLPSRPYRIESQAQRPRRRVIDLEKESVVLMINALEIIGDCYGVYGFSSSGRDNVELQVIKEMDEAFSSTVERRIDMIRPLFSTRMGPAIRHAISKLEERDARTKILFMVSDGYPQDRDYGQDSDDKEYALRDTEMAFVEAKRKNIVPFCLTIDAAGYDFLKDMSHDIAHKVLLDIESLPRHLPSLYKRLTS